MLWEANDSRRLEPFVRTKLPVKEKGAVDRNIILKKKKRHRLKVILWNNNNILKPPTQCYDPKFAFTAFSLPLISSSIYKPHV